MNKWRLGSISNVVLASLLCAQAAVVPPPWADPNHNPCASQPGGWQLIYWPADKKCYRIFQRGYPCPETMELGPGLDKGTPECNCPPGSAQHNVDGLCYPIFQKGPCESNQYFAPEPDRADRQRLGKCTSPEPCPEINSIFYPRDKKCYQKFTKGPCAEGQLITLSKNSPLIAECRCDTEQMSEFYWEPGGTCHQHYTTGPCQERGGLFLPGGQCGCHHELPHYHNPSGKCYQLGGIGPCPPGHQFTHKSRKYAECSCKDGYVKWSGDGSCYRPYTRGPCSSGHMYSVNITTSGMEIGCVPLPCSTGKLYFPGGKGCHKVGTQGPCPTGQLVLFQDSVKTSVEGISYLGMCGCARYNQENTFFPTPFGTDGGNSCSVTSRQNESGGKIQAQTLSKEPREDICINKRGMITWSDGTCRQLYAQGPCSSGEWVVPDRGKGQRQGRGWWKGKCECRPGYTITIISTTNENENKTLCQAPTVILAKFLNNKTSQYNKLNRQDEFDENGNKIETSSPRNKFNTKLFHIRNNNSKVTKLNTLLSTEEEIRRRNEEENNYQTQRGDNDRTKNIRNNDDQTSTNSYRRNNRFRNHFETNRYVNPSEEQTTDLTIDKRNKENIDHDKTIEHIINTEEKIGNHNSGHLSEVNDTNNRRTHSNDVDNHEQNDEIIEQSHVINTEEKIENHNFEHQTEGTDANDKITYNDEVHKQNHKLQDEVENLESMETDTLSMTEIKNNRQQESQQKMENTFQEINTQNVSSVYLNKSSNNEETIGNDYYITSTQLTNIPPITIINNNDEIIYNNPHNREKTTNKLENNNQENVNEILKTKEINKHINEINKRILNRINSKSINFNHTIHNLENRHNSENHRNIGDKVNENKDDSRIENQNGKLRNEPSGNTKRNMRQRENVSNNREGRKYNTNNEEINKTHQTIHDDISEYIKQQNQEQMRLKNETKQKLPRQEETRERLQNHKIGNEKFNENGNENRFIGDVFNKIKHEPIPSNFSKPDNIDDKHIEQTGTIEDRVINDLIPNISKQDTPTEINEMKAKHIPIEKTSAVENLDEQTAQTKTTNEAIRPIRNRPTNRHEIDEDETLIMVENKKGLITDRRKFIDLRKHIKHYVKPIIIFE